MLAGLPATSQELHSGEAWTFHLWCRIAIDGTVLPADSIFTPLPASTLIRINGKALIDFSGAGLGPLCPETSMRIGEKLDLNFSICLLPLEEEEAPLSRPKHLHFEENTGGSNADRTLLITEYVSCQTNLPHNTHCPKLFNIKCTLWIKEKYSYKLPPVDSNSIMHMHGGKLTIMLKQRCVYMCI